MVLKLGHSGRSIRNFRKVLKCVAGKGWRKSVSRRTGIFYVE
jgi:hypothetical protein